MATGSRIQPISAKHPHDMWSNLSSGFRESTGSNGLSVSRSGLMHLARDADPCQRLLLGPFVERIQPFSRGQSSFTAVRISRNHRRNLPKFLADQHIFRNFQTSLLNGLIIEPSVGRVPDVVLAARGERPWGWQTSFPVESDQWGNLSVSKSCRNSVHQAQISVT